MRSVPVRDWSQEVSWTSCCPLSSWDLMSGSVMLLLYCPPELCLGRELDLYTPPPPLPPPPPPPDLLLGILVTRWPVGPPRSSLSSELCEDEVMDPFWQPPALLAKEWVVVDLGKVLISLPGPDWKEEKEPVEAEAGKSLVDSPYGGL